MLDKFRSVQWDHEYDKDVPKSSQQITQKYLKCSCIHCERYMVS